MWIHRNSKGVLPKRFKTNSVHPKSELIINTSLVIGSAVLSYLRVSSEAEDIKTVTNNP